MSDQLPDFPLAPWELPPDSSEPLVAPATMRWHGTLFGRETDWLVRVVPFDAPHPIGHICVRAASSQEEGNCFLQTPFPIWPNVEQMRVHILKRMRSHKRFFRFFHLRHGGRDWRFWLRDDERSWVGLLGESAAVFSIEWPFDLLTASAAQIHNEVLRSWNDENSDLSYTREWILLSQTEKYARKVQWTRGTEADFLRLMRLVLLALGAHSSEPLRWWFHPIRRLFSLEEPAYDGFPDCDDPFAPEWGQALVDVYAPVWNEELAQTRACTRSLYNFSKHFAAIVERPTFHEQLEAARELHCWLDERRARNELDAATLARLRDTLR